MRDHLPYLFALRRRMRDHSPHRDKPMRAAILVLLFCAALFASVRSSFGQQENSFSSSVQFVDVAATAGLRDRIVNGGEKTKKYVFESTGSGVALLDYDGDDDL